MFMIDPVYVPKAEKIRSYERVQADRAIRPSAFANNLDQQNLSQQDEGAAPTPSTVRVYQGEPAAMADIWSESAVRRRWRERLMQYFFAKGMDLIAAAAQAEKFLKLRAYKNSQAAPQFEIIDRDFSPTPLSPDDQPHLDIKA
jgi:hypothetical protein